jgi:hypothetical protein
VLVLVLVKNKRKRSMPVRPPGVEQTSRLGSRDLVASRVKCGPHAGKNSKMKSCTVPWSSLKAKIKSGLRGGPSHEWRLAGGHTESTGFPVVHHKTTGFLGGRTKPRPKTKAQ